MSISVEIFIVVLRNLKSVSDNYFQEGSQSDKSLNFKWQEWSCQNQMFAFDTLFVRFCYRASPQSPF